MKDMNCCLTVACHRSLEERLVGHLLEHPEWVYGFIMFNAEGGSQKEKLPSMIEQVRGRSQRVAIQAVMNLEDARALVTSPQTRRKQSGNCLLDHARYRIREDGMSILRIIAIALCLGAATTYAAESSFPDLPPHEQVDAALNGNISVMNAETEVSIEQVNQRKWQSGNYESICARAPPAARSPRPTRN